MEQAYGAARGQTGRTCRATALSGLNWDSAALPGRAKLCRAYDAETRRALLRRIMSGSERIDIEQIYCFSKTAVVFVGCPCALVPLPEMVVTFPSSEITIFVV